MYRIVETQSAAQELEDIIEYIAKTLANPTAAADLVGSIDQCYREMEQMPKIYEECRDARLKALGYRKAAIKNYILIYRIDEATETVYILHCLYGRRNYEKLI